MELTLDDIKILINPKKLAEDKIIEEINSFVDACHKIREEVSPVNPKSTEWIQAVDKLLSTLLHVSKPKEIRDPYEEFDQQMLLGQVRARASELTESLR